MTYLPDWVEVEYEPYDKVFFAFDKREPDMTIVGYGYCEDAAITDLMRQVDSAEHYRSVSQTI